MSRSIWFLSLFFGTGCFDFGYEGDLADVPVFQADGGVIHPDAGDADAGATCEEGVVDSQSAGEVIHFIVMDVDRRALTIPSGTVVVWDNTDTETHSVVVGAPGAELPVGQGGFDSGNIAPRQKWAFRFCAPRTIVYFCRPHAEQMNGYRIVVE